jgi:hypothetical protein
MNTRYCKKAVFTGAATVWMAVAAMARERCGRVAQGRAGHLDMFPDDVAQPSFCRVQTDEKQYQIHLAAVATHRVGAFPHKWPKPGEQRLLFLPQLVARPRTLGGSHFCSELLTTYRSVPPNRSRGGVWKTFSTGSGWGQTRHCSRRREPSSYIHNGARCIATCSGRGSSSELEGDPFEEVEFVIA